MPHAAVVARAFGAEIVVLRVLEAPGGVMNSAKWQLARAEAAAYVQELAERLGREGLTVRGKSLYHLEVVNPEGAGGGIAELVLDGEPLAGETVPLLDDGRPHRLVARLGAALGPRVATEQRLGLL